MGRKTIWDISSDKLPRFHTGYEVEISREKLNLLTATQNDTITTNYIKMKTYYAQENSKYRDRDEMVDHIIN